MARAWLLGERLGLPGEWLRWRRISRIVGLVLAALVALSALAAARAVVGEARTINAVAAFVTLLGLHFITFALWVLGSLWPRALSGPSLGRWALELAARVAASRALRGGPSEASDADRQALRSPHAFMLLRALYRLLQQRRLMSWAFGAISHAIWALAFVLVLGVLAFGFAFHAYQLSWESTILSTRFFQAFVHATGVLPSWLGFPVPDAAAVQTAGAGQLQAWGAAASQREWAWWLMGCVFAYGLLPRVLAGLLSYACWRAGVARMRMIDTADPYVRQVFDRLDALDSAVVTDPEDRHEGSITEHAAPGEPALPDTLALVGFELPPEVPWPLTGLPEELHGQRVLEQRIAGSAGEVQQVRAVLERARPWTLVVAAYASASPDRGTARFLRSVGALAPECRLLLVSGGGEAVLRPDDEGARRWRQWLADEPLDRIKLIVSSESSQTHA